MAKHYKRLRPLLGTFVEIGVVATGLKYEVGVTKAFDAIEKIQRLLSFQDPNSDLSILNQSYSQEVVLNPISIRVLRLAQSMTRASGGLFNFTVGGKLIDLGVLPNHSKKAVLPSGGADDLIISGRKVTLRRPVQITLDGIAKGFAVDAAIDQLKKHRVSGGWVNAGGDLRVFGSVKLPVSRRESSGFRDLGYLQNSALATSEILIKADKRYIGRLVAPDERKLTPEVWTVKAEFAWKADALTKVAGLAADAQKMNIVRQLGGEILLHETVNL
jgi:thiamine biosynthesis lipoprotein